MLQLVCNNPRSDLHQEDDAKEDGEGESHAVVLLDSAAATEEGDEKYNATHDDQDVGVNIYFKNFAVVLIKKNCSLP